MHEPGPGHTLARANTNEGRTVWVRSRSIPALRRRMSAPARRLRTQLAARDFDKLRSLLDPEVEFRALTPRRSWEADGDSPTVDLFRNWFDEATVIEQVEQVERHGR